MNNSRSPNADQPEHRVEQHAAGQHQCDPPRPRWSAPASLRSAHSDRARPRYRRDDGDRGTIDKILEQQDRECELALRRIQVAVGTKHWQHLAVDDKPAAGRSPAQEWSDPKRHIVNMLSSNPQITTCAKPSPKISFRNRHNRLG